MKTRINHKLLNALLATFACLTFGQVTVFAAAGGSSGNGNGDAAFAFQRIIDDNPGLDDIEILKKAFNESSGRLPTIIDGNNPQNKALLAFKSEVSGYKGVMIFRSMESGEIVAKGISQNTWMINKTIEKGPLLSASTKKYLFFFNDATKTNNYILDFKTGYVSFNNYWAKNQKIMEVRQFNSDIIIYAIYATVIEGKAVCKYDHEDNFSTLAYSYDSADLIPGQICAIGYTWKSK